MVSHTKNPQKYFFPAWSTYAVYQIWCLLLLISGRSSDKAVLDKIQNSEQSSQMYSVIFFFPPQKKGNFTAKTYSSGVTEWSVKCVLL